MAIPTMIGAAIGFVTSEPIPLPVITENSIRVTGGAESGTLPPDG